MSAPEFSRTFDVRQCEGRAVVLTANEAERAALAARFDLERIDALQADLTLHRQGGDVVANGRIRADYVQLCAVSAEDLPVRIDEAVSLRFVPARVRAADEDMEIDSDDPDEIEYTGSEIDLGEAVSQSFALSIDPFATGPEAEEARERLRADADSPFAALAALKRTADDGADG